MLLPSGGEINIGQRNSLNQYVVINGEGGVNIDDDVVIAAFVPIFAANHHYERVDIPMSAQGMYSKGGVQIGDDVCDRHTCCHSRWRKDWEGLRYCCRSGYYERCRALFDHDRRSCQGN